MGNENFQLKLLKDAFNRRRLLEARYDDDKMKFFFKRH